MTNPVDPFDEISQDEIFQELRSFASTPVPENPQILANLVEEFKSAQLLPTRKWFKRVVIPTVTIVIAVPSLAYAGLLPESVSTDIKQIVHNVTTVVSKPIVAISNSITGSSNEPRLNSTPSGSPSPDASAVVTSPIPGEENNSETNPANGGEQSQNDQGNEGDEEQVSVVAPSPSNSPIAARPTATKKSEKSSEEHKSSSSIPNSIASPNSSGGEHDNAQENDTEQSGENHTGSPSPSRSGQALDRSLPSPTSTSRERESEKSRVRSSATPAPIGSPSSAEHEND